MKLFGLTFGFIKDEALFYPLSNDEEEIDRVAIRSEELMRQVLPKGLGSMKIVGTEKQLNLRVEYDPNETTAEKIDAWVKENKVI